MKILTSSQIRAVEAYTIENEPVLSIDLMERAANACVEWICCKLYRYLRYMKVAVFAGPGNNGGDGLAIARLLHENDCDVSVYMLTESSELSPDALTNFERLKGKISPVVLTEKNIPELRPVTIVIDALFGIGLSRSLDGLAAKVVDHINHCRCMVVAIDMPSGLFGEDNTKNISKMIMYADYTLTFHRPKLSFFFKEYSEFIGEWEVLDIGLSAEATEKQESKYFMLEQGDIEAYIEPREKFSHKGEFRHVMMIAGSQGMMGASVLATKACIGAGAGIVTAHVPKDERQILQISVPEAIVSMDENPEVFSQVPDFNEHDVIAVGPGIGKKTETKDALLLLLKKIKSWGPFFPENVIFDADALNIISENKDLLKELPPESILTPHPKEFDRLFGAFWSGYQRHLKQIEMAQKYGVVIVLKGAHTSIATPEGKCFFNNTGNPGMATAGSGDVLTGIIAALCAQCFLTTYKAACAGVWLHGKAGDIAARKKGQEALTASDIIKNIGKAFKELKYEKY